MARQLVTIVVGVMLLASVVVFGSSAYTTATIERQGDMNVVSDASGLIGLEPGNSSQVVQNSSGELKIDFTRNGASGVNTNANYTIGDPASPTSTFAFNISNHAGQAYTFDVSYDGFDSTDTSTDNLQFRVYDSSETYQTELNASTTTASFDVSPEETYYVVMIINTGDGVEDLETGDTLNGTLTVTV